MLTAFAIAKSIGLVPVGAQVGSGLARDAKDLRMSNGTYLSEQQIDDITSSTNVFARATPEDKLVIMNSLQRMGHTCAMTGDGGTRTTKPTQVHICTSSIVAQLYVLQLRSLLLYSE